MPTLLELIGRGAGPPAVASSGLLRTVQQIQASKTGIPTEELRQQVADLEALQLQTGAREIEQDRPGIFATVVDLLSRPNFAVAGAAEELFQGNTILDAAGRALSEIFSGVGPIEGQKRAFGQVLEGAGVGTKTLADAIPALEGTWVGSFGSRGAAGLALDIALDPLTYLTFGTKAVTTVGRGAKQILLNRRGAQALDTIRAGMQGRLDDLLRTSDTNIQAIGKFEDEVAERFRNQFSADVPEELLELGGIKIAGRSIVRGETLSALRGNLVDAVRKIPGASTMLDAGAEFSTALRKNINGMFHPNNELGNLPPAFRDTAIKLRRDFASLKLALSGRKRSVIKHGGKTREGLDIPEDLARKYQRLVKADADIGKKLYEVKYGRRALSELTPEAQEVYTGFSNLLKDMGDDLVRFGVMTADELRAGNYFPSVYKNTKEVIEQYHFARDGRFNGSIKESFQKQRVFDDPFEAETISGLLEDLGKVQIGQDKAVRLYGKLDPDFDLLSNVNRYVEQWSEAVARQGWQEQLVHEVGRKIDDFDLNAIYEGVKPFDVNASDRGIIEVFFGPKNARNFRDLVDEERVVGPGVPKLSKAEATTQVIRAANAAMRNLSGDGKREMIRRLVESSNSSSQLASILNGLHGQYADFFPTFRAIREGEEAIGYKNLFGGVEAQYVPVKSKFTGDNGVIMPKIIWDDMQRVNSKLFNTRDYEAFGKLLKGFDFVNNTFKMGVYTFWPASALRDAYSNVALSMLDIGVGALNPRAHLDSIGIMAGRKGTLKTVGGVRYQWEDLSRMAEDFGVVVPGEVFAELTGDPAKFGTVAGKVERGLKAAARKRGLIENEARVQLWIQNIRRGVDPRKAADHVNEFLFNYGELSSFEREFMRRLIPFYTFTRKNIALQVKALRRNPGLSINQLKPFRGRTDENEGMVKFESEALKLRLDKDGKSLHVLTGIDLPLRNLDTVWKGGFGATGRSLMGMMTPVLKVPIEVTVGRDLFTGGDLKRARADTLGRIIEATGTPKPLRDWFGYKKEVDEAGRPKYTVDGARYAMVVRSWMFSRLFSTSDRQFREYLSAGDPNIWAAMLDVSTGIRYKEINMDEQERSKLFRRRRQLQDALARRGVIRPFEVAGRADTEGI